MQVRLGLGDGDAVADHQGVGEDPARAAPDRPVRVVDGRGGARPGPCHRRLRELERSGVITGYRALVNPAAVGMGFEALVQITLERGDAGTVASFETALAELPQVRHAERLFGDPDYLLRVAARDFDSFATLRDQTLATLPGIHRLTSTIVMKRIIDNRPVLLATRDD